MVEFFFGGQNCEHALNFARHCTSDTFQSRIFISVHEHWWVSNKGVPNSKPLGALRTQATARRWLPGNCWQTVMQHACGDGGLFRKLSNRFGSDGPGSWSWAYRWGQSGSGSRRISRRVSRPNNWLATPTMDHRKSRTSSRRWDARVRVAIVWTYYLAILKRAVQKLAKLPVGWSWMETFNRDAVYLIYRFLNRFDIDF